MSLWEQFCGGDNTTDKKYFGRSSDEHFLFNYSYYGSTSFSRAVKRTLYPSVAQGANTIGGGLLGTTIVPYNLFLHAHLVQQQKRTGLSLKALEGTPKLPSVLAE